MVIIHRRLQRVALFANGLSSASLVFQPGSPACLWPVPLFNEVAKKFRGARGYGTLYELTRNWMTIAFARSLQKRPFRLFSSQQGQSAISIADRVGRAICGSPAVPEGRTLARTFTLSVLEL